MDIGHKRSSSFQAIELLGNNLRFLTCMLSAVTIAYCLLVALLISAVFVPVPRILHEIMPSSYQSVVSWTSRYIIMACDFTSCALLLGIFLTLTNHRTFFYIFFIFLCATIVMESTIFFFFVYNPINQLGPILTKYMLSLMNQDVKLMERKGIDIVATLEEVNNRPLAKLQRALACCGVESVRDWELRIEDMFKTRPHNESIPISCCWHPFQKEKYFCTALEAYKDSCLSRVMFYLERLVMRTSRLMITLICLQLILLSFYWNKVHKFLFLKKNV